MENIVTYCFDLDGTLCYSPQKLYKDSIPYIEVIEKVNKLYDDGCKIVIFTARGGTSKIDYNELTVSQLKKWNVKYHELIDKNKPHFDILIDDKAINAKTWREQNNIFVDEPNYIERYLSEVKSIADMLDRKELINFIDCIKQCKENKGRLFVLGVGGSAANASHAVNDFRKICGIETYSVSENVAELTARINDESWKTCYTNWLKVSNLSKNDVLMIFSVGGGSDTTSQNLVDAMLYGKSIGSKIVSIVSRDGGIAKKESDACVLIPVINNSRITPHAEEWQGVVLHLVVNYLSYEH